MAVFGNPRSLDKRSRPARVTEVTRDDVVRMVQVLRDLHDETGAFSDEYGAKPDLNSLARQELSTFQDGELVKTAYAQGSLLIEVAADYLMAFTRIVKEPVQTIAPWTCVRGLIESCAFAAWLLDPGVDVRVRVQRSFAFRFEGLSQQVKYVRTVGSQVDINNASQRMDDVERKAQALGFSRVENRKGQRIGIAQRMPPITDVVNLALGQESEYRLLSAMAHAHPWALQQLSFRLEEDHGRIGLAKSAPTLAIAYLCVTGARAFSKPILARAQLFGWDVKRLQKLLDTAFGNLGVQGVGG